MRQANIQEVGMENFGPYLDPMILEFKNDAMVLMTGPNGVGKTMSLDAIPFTFYGITSKGAKGDDVVNNIVGRNCKTWVKFSVDDDQYLITRYQKYSKLGNTVVLNKNNVDIKKGHMEVLPEIEKLICSSRAFMNTLMFGQKVKNFFTDLVDSDKKLIFREILALEQYQLFYKETDTRVKQIVSDLNEIEKKKGINESLQADTQTQIQILLSLKKKYEEEKQTTLVEFKQSIDTNQRLLKEWQDELTVLQKEDLDIISTNAKLSNIETKLNLIQSDLNSAIQSMNQQKETKLLEIKNKVTENKSELFNLSQKEHDRIRDEQAQLKETLNDLIATAQAKKHKVELQIQDIESNIRHWQEQSHEINENVIKAGIAECPLCKQPVSDETLNLLGEKVAHYDRDVNEALEKVSLLKEQLKGINSEMSNEVDVLNMQNSTLTNEYNQIQKIENEKIFDIDTRWKVAVEKINEFATIQIQKIEEETKSTKAELESQTLTLLEKKKEQEAIKQKIDEIDKTIENINNDIKRKEFEIQAKEAETYDMTQLNSYKKRQMDLEAEVHLLSVGCEALERKQGILDFWKTGFSSSGIPSMLIDEAIPFMNRKVAEYLDKFTNGRYIVSFDTLAATKAGEFRDKISVNVVDTHTRANSRVQLSGGQTRIIDIATILTLGDLQASIQDLSINILLFDEIFDSLDEENIGYVSKVLSKLKFGKSIYLISHRHEDQLETDEVLTLH